MAETIDFREAKFGPPGKEELTEQELEGLRKSNEDWMGLIKKSEGAQKAIEEQGINAFKLGGPVDIDKMLAEL